MPELMPHRMQHFKANCLAWVALYHFLPANLLRELSYVLVDAVGDGQIRFDQLFQEDLVGGPEGLESWAVRPLDNKDSVAQYLQHRIRYFVWANDGEVYYDRNRPQPDDAVGPGAIEGAIRLGQIDLGTLEQVIDQLKFPPQPSIHALAAAIRKTRELRHSPQPAESLAAIVEFCGTIEMPLAAVVMKHLGDLCADDDTWESARQFYQASFERLRADKTEAWQGYLGLLLGITTQSIAAALRITRGPMPASAFLSSRLELADLSGAPLFLLNASPDAYVAEFLASETMHFPSDRRASILSEPLLLKSQDLSSAFEAWIEGEHLTAHRHFWSVLRRQIALGSANDARMTKAFYAKCVFSALERTADRELNRSLFAMGIRLLVQSEQADLAKKIDWSAKLVRAYVDKEAVGLLLSQTNAIDASKDERVGAALELLRGWCLVLPADRAPLATQMLRFIATVAATHKSSFSNRRNVGGRGMEALRDVAEKRPEFRAGIAPEIVPAILSKFEQGEFWTGTAEALNLSARYFDVLEPKDIRAIVSATLSLLDKMDPSRDVWVLVRPALDLLVSQEVQRLSKQDRELGNRIVSTILRFGLNQKTEHTRLLFYLYHFDLGSVYEEPTLTQLKEVVDDVRKQALTIYASNAIDNVCALLLASSAAGPDGVKDALHALTLALNTAVGEPRRIALAFPFAYQAFLILAERQEQIARDIAENIDEFRARLRPFVDQLVELWSHSTKNPVIFASFSFPPPTKPNPVIIHNWAFASIAFAKSLGEEDKILSALKLAAEEPELKERIALARAIRLGLGELETFDPASIRSDNAETFYSALGQRLVSLQQIDADARPSILDALLDQCLRYGPNGLDAAVFLIAGRPSIERLCETPAYLNYVKRLENNSDLRLTLMPLLAERRTQK
jgi:hypothetical protein